MNEEEFHVLYDEVEKGTTIKVTWSVPAEMSGVGKEVLFSEPDDQGTFEGIEGSAAFIPRSNGSLKNYPLSSIHAVEVVS